MGWRVCRAVEVAGEKTMKTIFLAALITLVLSGNAWGDVNNYEGIKTIRIIVDDNVTGKCWSNPSSAKTFIEKEFLSSGISVLDEGYGGAFFSLSVVGLPVTNKAGNNIGCAVSVRVQVWYSSPITTLAGRSKHGTVEIYLHSTLLISSGDLTSIINEYAKEQAAIFAVNVLKANMDK